MSGSILVSAYFPCGLMDVGQNYVPQKWQGPILTQFWPRAISLVFAELCECRCHRQFSCLSEVLVPVAWLDQNFQRDWRPWFVGCAPVLYLNGFSTSISWWGEFVSVYPSGFWSLPALNSHECWLALLEGERLFRARVLSASQKAERYFAGEKGRRDIVVRAGCKKARSQHLLHYIRFNMRLSRKWVFLLPLFKETWQSRCRRKRQTNPTREAIRRLSLHKVSNLFVIIYYCTYIYNIIICKVSNVDVAMTNVQHVRHASCLVELRKQCAAGEVQGDEVLCVVLLVKYPMISHYIPRYILLYPIIFPQCPHYCWLHTFITHLQSAWITIIIKLFKHV